MTQKKTDLKQLEKKRWRNVVLANVLPFVLAIVFFRFGASVCVFFPLIYVALTQVNVFTLVKVDRIILADLIMLGTSTASILLNTLLYYAFISSDDMTPAVGIASAMICGGICIAIEAFSLILHVISYSASKKLGWLSKDG